MEDLASPSPSVVVVLASFNGVARQSRRGAARSRLIIAFPALSPPGLSDWLPSAARLPGLRASAGGSKFAAAAGDEASRSSACSSLVSTRLAVVTFFLAAANGQQQILSAAQAAVGVPGAPAFRGSPQSPAVLRVPRAAVCRASFWRGRRRVCPLYVSTVKY